MLGLPKSFIYVSRRSSSSTKVLNHSGIQELRGPTQRFWWGPSTVTGFEHVRVLENPKQISILHTLLVFYIGHPNIWKYSYM